MALTIAKKYNSHKYSVIILRSISKGDEHVRRVYHEVLHFYSEGKYKVAFFATKKLPLKAKLEVSKIIDRTKQFGGERFGPFNNLRDSKEIQKPENISEYFKSISEVERGGELHDDYSEAKSETEPLVVESVVEAISISTPKETVTKIETNEFVRPASPKAKRAPKAPKMAQEEPTAHTTQPEPSTTPEAHKKRTPRASKKKPELTEIL